MKLTKEQIEDVMILAKNNKKLHNEQRWGQAFFNALNILYPDAANSVRATKYDPFYSNAVVEKCIKFLVYE